MNTLRTLNNLSVAQHNCAQARDTHIELAEATPDLDVRDYHWERADVWHARSQRYVGAICYLEYRLIR